MIPLLLTAMLLGVEPPQEPVHYPPRPGPREFILDQAKLVTPEEAGEIRNLCESALTEKKAPIIVVTIPSLASYGAAGWPIERYAMNLMAEWGVGWPDWNYGMLLLVSPGDRKARIELGGSWARRKDEDAQRVMAEAIIPRFKQGDFGKGILEGVRGLHAIALDATPRPPARPGPMTPNPAADTPSLGVPKAPCGFGGILGLGVIAILVMFVISRLGRGVNSWGSGGPGNLGGGGFGSSLGGGMLGGALGSMLYNAIARHGSSSSSSTSGGGFSPGSSGGSFGGGSFGGGFSGGGGATGSW